MNAENKADEVNGEPSPQAEPPSGEAADVPSGAPAESVPAEPPAPAETPVVSPEPVPAPVVSPEPVPVPRRGHVAPAHIPLERIDEDTSLQVRPVGELTALATDLARLGQLSPVDVRFKPPDRFQIISGFRRVAALRFLKRDRVLARLHTDLSDEDALLMALASAIHASPVDREDLEAQRARLESEGRLTPIARDMLDKALATDDALAPETVEEEVDADELAVEATQRLVDINQDLALLADVFSDLDETRKQELLTQLRYSSDLVAWLERL
ncbi:ParB N-terminal domain-containing protein [Melittangium boletus]|uniref:ParB N-terminal domain-containing protein n=1 Tax=Melittangium boletus TaxID=83453 RepID=UPI003DA4D0FF